MRVKVGSLCALVYNGVEYHGGETFDVPDEHADAWLASGLVLPAEEDCREPAGNDD